MSGINLICMKFTRKTRKDPESLYSENMRLKDMNMKLVME